MKEDGKGAPMMKRIGWIVITAAVISSLWAFGHRPVQAEEKDITQMLDRVLKNQEKMMQDLEWIKKELDVVRIRTR